MAEQNYRAFALQSSETYLLRHPNSRLFSVSFEKDRRMMYAQVGEDFLDWPEPTGPVLAIVETTHMICIHTQRGVLRQDGPILVGTDALGARVYFDDYPVLP